MTVANDVFQFLILQACDEFMVASSDEGKY